MKPEQRNRCYPLWHRLHPWEYLLPLGLIAGPGLLPSALDYSGRNESPLMAVVFLIVILFVGVGWHGLKLVIGNMIPLTWDEQEVRWLFRKRKWSELCKITMLNETTRHGNSGAMLKFDRILVFSDQEGRERLRIPFQCQDYLSQEVLRQKDPAWLVFLQDLERRFCLSPGTLVQEQELARYRDEEKRAAAVPWPSSRRWNIAIMVIGGLYILSQILFAWGGKSVFVLCLMAMLIWALYEKKTNWQRAWRRFYKRADRS